MRNINFNDYRKFVEMIFHRRLSFLKQLLVKRIINASFEFYQYRRIRNFSQFSVEFYINIVLRIVFKNVFNLYIIITKLYRVEYFNKKTRKICNY